MGSYLPHTEEERGEMLEAIGVHTIEELYRSVPQEMLLSAGLDLPEGADQGQFLCAEKPGIPKRRPGSGRLPPYDSLRWDGGDVSGGTCDLLYPLPGGDQPRGAAGNF